MADGALDLSKLSKKIWLVKVPATVAASWRPLCEAAMNPSNLEEDAPPIQLGSVRVETNQEAGMNVTLTAAGANGKPPRAFKLTQLDTVPGSVVVALSYKADGQQETPVDNFGNLSAEGYVDASFNAMPILTDDKVDASYAAMNKERTIKASTKTRTVQMYEDTRENNLSRLFQNKVTNLDVKRKGEEARRARDDSKRVKADVDVLERELFTLFERQPHWSMARLVEETRQASSHLKSVLEKIAVFNKQGPNRDKYQLKKDYSLAATGEPGTTG